MCTHMPCTTFTTICVRAREHYVFGFCGHPMAGRSEPVVFFLLFGHSSAVLIASQELLIPVRVYAAPLQAGLPNAPERMIVMIININKKKPTSPTQSGKQRHGTRVWCIMSSARRYAVCGMRVAAGTRHRYHMHMNAFLERGLHCGCCSLGTRVQYSLSSVYLRRAGLKVALLSRRERLGKTLDGTGKTIPPVRLWGNDGNTGATGPIHYTVEPFILIYEERGSLDIVVGGEQWFRRHGCGMWCTLTGSNFGLSTVRYYFSHVFQLMVRRIDSNVVENFKIL